MTGVTYEFIFDRTLPYSLWIPGKTSTINSPLPGEDLLLTATPNRREYLLLHKPTQTTVTLDPGARRFTATTALSDMGVLFQYGLAELVQKLLDAGLVEEEDA